MHASHQLSSSGQQKPVRITQINYYTISSIDRIIKDFYDTAGVKSAMSRRNHNVTFTLSK